MTSILQALGACTGLLKRVSPSRMGRAGHRGFGLMEILIAMAVGMIAMVVVAQTFAVTEGQRRTTTSGSDAQQTALVTLSLLEGTVLNAGMNLTGTFDAYMYKMVANTTTGEMTLEGEPPKKPNFLLGCNARYGATGPTIRMAPVTIANGASGAVPDTITIVGGNNAIAGGGAPVPAAQSIPAGSTNFMISNGIGYAVGDWIVIAEQNGMVTGSRNLPKSCSLAQITALPDIATSPTPFLVVNRGVVEAYENPWIFNLGRNPVMSVYSVVNGRLQVDDLLDRWPTAVLSEGVVNLQAQYGFDVNSDDQIDQWLQPTFVPLNPMNSSAALTPTYPVVLPALGQQSVNQVKAVRIGIGMRSNQIERPDSSGNCTTSPTRLDPVLAEEPDDPAAGIPGKPSSGTVSLSATARCYRYYSHATVVPIYNMLWSDL